MAAVSERIKDLSRELRAMVEQLEGKPEGGQADGGRED